MVKMNDVSSLSTLTSVLKQSVYSRQGMLCDDDFLKQIVGELFEIFDREDLDDPTMQWDTAWDGELEATFTNNVHMNIVLQINPQYCNGEERETLTACTVGEFIITREKWAEWLNELDKYLVQ